MDTQKTVSKYQSLEEIQKEEGLPEKIRTEVQLWDEILKKEFFAMPANILPLVAEAHGKVYPPGISVEPIATEYSVERSPKKEITSIRADSMIRVDNRDIYHFECEIHVNETIILRVMEYSFQEALTYAERIGYEERTDTNFRIRFPRSAVILLQTGDDLPAEITCEMILPDETVYTYKVPTIQVQNYSVRNIQEKKLYSLIPFMPVRFRKELGKRNPDFNKVEKELTCFYKDIIVILDEAVRDGQLRELEQKEILELLYKAMIRVTRKNEQLAKVVSEMAMPLIEFEFERADRLERTLKEVMEEKKEAIQKAEEELRKSEEELRKKNEELDRKNSIISEQKETIAMLGAQGSQETRREGEIKGKRDAIFELLEELGPVPEEIRQEIMKVKDMDKLKRWLKLAARATSIEDFSLS